MPSGEVTYSPCTLNLVSCLKISKCIHMCTCVYDIDGCVFIGSFATSHLHLQFIRDELNYKDGFDRQSAFHGADDLISVSDLWRLWIRSPGK